MRSNLKGVTVSDEACRAFLATLRHRPDRAIARIRSKPNPYLALALRAAAESDPEDARGVVTALMTLFPGKNGQRFAWYLLSRIPSGSLHLGDLARQAGRFLLRNLRVRNDLDAFAKAEISKRHSEWLAAAGDSAGGLKYAQRAVQTLRLLGRKGRVISPHLPIALQVAAKRLSELHLHSQAINIATEAVNASSSTSTDPMEVNAWITARDTLAVCLDAAGELERAIREAQLTQSAIETMAAQGLVIDEPITVSHLRLATLLAGAGHFNAALMHAPEAWTRSQSLAHTDRPRFEHLYLWANDVLTACQTMSGVPNCVGANIEESPGLLEQLASTNPKVYLLRYALYLMRQSALLAASSPTDEAMELAERALSAPTVIEGEDADSDHGR
jgi:tetratricopeptide (TPR) repeat protein